MEVILLFRQLSEIALYTNGDKATGTNPLFRQEKKKQTKKSCKDKGNIAMEKTRLQDTRCASVWN